MAVARRYAEGIVMVRRGASQSAQGFLVSSSGLVCSVLPGVKVHDVVAVSADETLGNAAVVAADADGLCLAQLTPAPSSPLTALGISADGKRSRWLVGLSRGADGVSATVGGGEDGGVLLVPVPRGAPILNSADDVVAVVVRRRGGGSVDVISAARVKKLAQGQAAKDQP